MPTAHSAPDAAPATTRADWTVDGVFFDTAGWGLAEASPASMRWVNAPGMTLTLTGAAIARSDSEPNSLTATRHALRAQTRANGGDIVSVEHATGAQGVPLLQTIFKFREGSGYRFEGEMSVADSARAYKIRVVGSESPTGLREALFSAVAFQLGAIELDAARGTATSVPISGWFQDAYEPAYDEGALNSAPDDPRLDPLLPAHPLSAIRSLMEQVRTTIELAAPPSAVEAPAAQDVPPPRQLLQPEILREIYWLGGRNDLLEPELQAALNALDPEGNGQTVAVARHLMMLGFVQQNLGKTGEARAAFNRAHAIMLAAFGDAHRETAVALTLRGQIERKVGDLAGARVSLWRAIQVFDARGDHGIHFTIAIGLLGDVLIGLGEHAKADHALKWAQRVLSHAPEQGPRLLRELTGGPPADVRTRISMM